METLEFYSLLYEIIFQKVKNNFLEIFTPNNFYFYKNHTKMNDNIMIIRSPWGIYVFLQCIHVTTKCDTWSVPTAIPLKVAQTPSAFFLGNNSSPPPPGLAFLFYMCNLVLFISTSVPVWLPQLKIHICSFWHVFVS